MKKITLIWLAFIMSQAVTTVATAQVNTQDSLALVALYNSAGGTAWKNKTGWLTGPVSTWYGITLTGNRVSSIDLSYNKLAGAVPASFKQLTGLHLLDISHNKLSTIQQGAFDDLTGLTRLRLNNNELSGALPSFDSIIDLDSLTLGNNKLNFTALEPIASKYPFARYVPQHALDLMQKDNSFSVSGAGGTFVNIYYYWFKDGQLIASHRADSTFMPPSAGTYFVKARNPQFVPKLVIISDTIQYNPQGVNIQDSLALVDFYNNTNGPSWYQNNTWLKGPVATWKGVTVSNNRVVKLVLVHTFGNTIPPSIGNLTALTYLDLSFNAIPNGSIPATIGNLTNLTYLDLSRNQIVDTIPASIGNLTKLTMLNLSQNRFTGTMPASLGNLLNIPELNLAGNRLRGSIPPEIGNLTKLKRLGLGNNYMTGTIPASLGNMTELTYLGIGSTEITGTIPASLGNLKNLQTLFLGSNKLTGEIPSALGGLTALRTLNLATNKLTGSVPSSLGNCTQLRDIDLSRNKLTGELPSSLTGCTRLRNLTLNDNQFTSIPSFLGQMDSLNYISIENNGITGTLPVSLGNIPDLNYVSFANNSLTGSLPSNYNNQGIGTLNLSHNNLSGQIPFSLTGFTSLYLQYNQFSGPLQQIQGVVNIDLSNNKFSGTVPTFTSPNVQSINFSYNEFSSVGSDFFADYGPNATYYLNRLVLDHNKLTSIGAHAFDRLTNLQNLTLNDNLLSGALPSFGDIIKFPEGMSLALENNKLTFLGIEQNAQKVAKTTYSPQAIVPLHKDGNKLFVAVGGTPANNTFYWYKDGQLVSTVATDSTFQPASDGAFYVQVKNSLATALTLQSDTTEWDGSGLRQTLIAGQQVETKLMGIYPNPSKSNAVLQFTANDKYTITITDMYGKTIHTLNGIAYKGLNTKNLNVSSYAPGLYYVTITDENGAKHTRKLVKQ